MCFTLSWSDVLSEEGVVPQQYLLFEACCSSVSEGQKVELVYFGRHKIDKCH